MDIMISFLSEEGVFPNHKYLIENTNEEFLTNQESHISKREKINEANNKNIYFYCPGMVCYWVKFPKINGNPHFYCYQFF